MTRPICVVFMWGLVVALASAQTPRPSPTISDADCLQYFHAKCHSQLGAWLPRLPVSRDVFHEAPAVRTARRDGIVYGHAPAGKDTSLYFIGPSDGTFFAYGNAGPPKGHVVYDPIHRITYYEEGCCSWSDVVAAADVSRPPVHVTLRDLDSLHTIRGIRLGQSPAQVMRVDGPGVLRPLAAGSGLAMLSYSTPISVPEVRNAAPSCLQAQNFVFAGGHLRFIQFKNAC